MGRRGPENDSLLKAIVSQKSISFFKKKIYPYLIFLQLLHKTQKPRSVSDRIPNSPGQKGKKKQKAHTFKQ